MDFHLTREQELVRQMMHDFTETRSQAHRCGNRQNLYLSP